MSSPTVSPNTLIYKGILTLVLQGFKLFLPLSTHHPARARHAPPAYSVIEEIVEGFVEGFWAIKANKPCHLDSLQLPISSHRASKRPLNP